jgi:sulfur-carrier protein
VGTEQRVRVRIPTPLRSYTQHAVVEATGATVDEVLHDLDLQFPGLRFRVVDEQGRLRQHMKVFVDQDITRDLDHELDPGVELTLMQALSGG